MDEIDNIEEAQELYKKLRNDTYKRQNKYKLIMRLLDLLTVNELDDVIEYLSVILRKKEMKGEFDHLKTFIKKTES